jgi:hypothetical protein
MKTLVKKVKRHLSRGYFFKAHCMIHLRFNVGCSACQKEKRRVEQDHRMARRILALLKENKDLTARNKRLEEENAKMKASVNLAAL